MKLPKLPLFALLSLLLQLTGGNGWAQCFDERNYIRYTRLHGLSNNYISGIEEDSTGYIWISTHKGLNRFDGKAFQSIHKGSEHSPLPDNHIVLMRHPAEDEIIGATRAGAFAFNPLCGQYKQFVIPCDSSIYFWTNHVFDILKDKVGNYVVSTKTGLYVFDPAGKLIKRYDYHIPSEVGSKELLFGHGVSMLKDGSILQQNGVLGSLYNSPTNTIDTFYVAKREGLKKHFTDELGNMRTAWGGRNGEAFILDREGNSIDVVDIGSSESYKNPMPFVVKSDLGWMSTLTYVNDSMLVITCRVNGFYVLQYNSHTRKLTCDGVRYFKGNVCTTVFRDRENRMWVGTADGLYKENKQDPFFSVADLSEQDPYLLDHEISSIHIEDSLIYAGLYNGGGLLVLDKKTKLIRSKIQFAPFGYSNSIFNILSYDVDTLWLGTRNGIVWLNKRNYHYGRLVLPAQLNWMQDVNTLCFFEDSKKNIWVSFGNLNSLVRFDRATRTFTDLSAHNNPLLRITFVFSMAEDMQGNIWLAGDGLCRWNVKKQVVDTLIPYPTVSRLIQNYMFILDRDPRNNLWLSSFDNELIQFNCTTNKMYLRQEESNHIDGNTITSSPIINDHIWMGTDNGISAFNINNYSVKQFTYADGLPSVAITSLKKESEYDKAENRFYVAARHKLISFVPDVTLSHKVAPTLFIEKIYARDSLITVPGEREIRLPYYMNNLSIQFNTVNFTDPEENRFAWRMIHENDTGWNEINTQTGITLNNLPGGMHPIQIKLFSANNHWPQQVKSLMIYIQPPFWLTLWFILIMGAGVTGLIIFIYRRRVNSVRKKERERAAVQQVIAEEYKNRLELEQIINYFSNSLTDKTELEEVLWDVMQNLIGRLGYFDCIIYLWNEDRTMMVQKAAFGPKGNPDVLASEVFVVYPGQGVVGHVMESREPVVIADTRNDRRYRVDSVPGLSEISVPIMHDEELLGVIDSEHPVVDYFKERDLKILTTIATLMGNKIKQIESEQSLEIHQQELAFINQQLAEAQLSALQTQMNPHFIFNCLNSIKGMILNDERQKASRYLSKFANMIRTTLNQSKDIFTTLYENIEHLENYLVMEKLRFDDSFSFEVIVDEDIDKEETLIPTLMIQPLAENAIWHGLMYKTGEKNLIIRFSSVSGAISCCIEDNGIGINRSEQLRKLSKSTHRSVGLSNLRNRIKIMNEKYDTGCTLEISDLQETDISRSGTRVVLRFKVITNKLYI